MLVFCFPAPERLARGDDRGVERRVPPVRSPRVSAAATMTSECPKVEFALGSEVSPGRFFKSAFARNFIGSGRDCKSLDYELLDNVGAGGEDRNNNARNNNFFSLVNFADSRPANGGDDAAAALWEQPKPKEVNAFCTVLQAFLPLCAILS